MPSLRRSSFRRTIREKISVNHYKSVHIRLLDITDKSIEIELTENMSGFILLENVCKMFGELLEKDYFGLRYYYRNDHKRWLDGSRSVHHQIKKARTTSLSFRVRHYPGNPVNDIMQDLTKYLFYLQLRRDLFSGNLLVKEESLFKLVSLVIQAEHGEITEPNEEEVFALIINLKIVENVNSRIVQEINKEILIMNGLNSKEAEKQFLLLVSQLESYGVEPYAVIDQTGENLFIAMNHQGICTFLGEKRKNLYFWEDICRMMFIKKTFVFEIILDNKKKKIGFKFSSENLAKEFWKWALDRQYFITLNSSSEAKKVRSNNVMFSRKITHRFSGRSMKELTTSCHSLNSIPQPHITRSGSSKAIYRQSVSLEDSESKLDSFDTLSKHSNTNKEIKDVSLGDEEILNEIALITSSEFPLTSNIETENEDSEPELPSIAEDEVIEEVIEPNESKIVESFVENDTEYIPECELLQRHIDCDLKDNETKSANNSAINDNKINDIHHSKNTDRSLLVKFFTMAPVVFLAVVVVSLVLFYYYRTSTATNLNEEGPISD